MPKIYTRTGDKGLTSVTRGERAPKDDIRVEAYGTLDEANATMGLLAARLRQLPGPFFAEAADRVQEAQNDLFNVGFDWVRNQDPPSIAAQQVEKLEQWIDQWYAAVVLVDDFVLPGGSEPAAWAQVARTLVRRAERRAIRLHRDRPLNPESLRYINRLSDMLFALARRINAELGAREATITRYGRQKPPNRRF
ncbi:MAG: cob(I)yrinic acid a,c-diamide adenosyltransferase [Thermaerobacter sp.]|nr:cob(I)yrinic acid a,c-diamide adenosyltransferase [Thermaerobacter sp.]